jgi:hypothetical protein
MTEYAPLKRLFLRDCTAPHLRRPTFSRFRCYYHILPTGAQSAETECDCVRAGTSYIYRYGVTFSYRDNFTLHFPAERTMCLSCIGMSACLVMWRSSYRIASHAFPTFLGLCAVVLCAENPNENIFFPCDFLTLQNRRGIWYKVQRKTGIWYTTGKSFPVTLTHLWYQSPIRNSN